MYQESRQESQDLFFEQARRFPGKKLFTFHGEGAPPVHLTGRSLRRRVEAAGQVLIRKTAPGEKVLLVLPQGLEFIYGLMACWYANVIAVPVPVTGFSTEDQTAEKIIPILTDSQATCVLTDSNLKSLLQSRPEFRSLTVLDVREAAEGAARGGQPRPRAGEDVSLLLYTSGSVSRPKGVLLSHGNLIAQARQGAAQWEMNSASRIVSWAPLFHSFGLIVGMISPLIAGASSVILPPGGFIRKPENWFRCLDAYKATHTGAPNFALDLCCAVIDPRSVAGLSVRSLEAIICGGEPIRQETWERFVEKFKPLGFSHKMLCPNFGLSETGGLCSKKAGRPPRFLALDPDAMDKGRVRSARRKGTGKSVACCGEIGAGITALAVHPDSCEPCGPDEIGEIWIKSPTVALGYLNRAEETAQTFSGTLQTGETGFFRTGDLGFIRKRDLFLIGRAKEVIIVSGKNFYPADIEWTIKTNLPELTLPRAAFAREIGGTERVTVVQEIAGPLPEEECRRVVQSILGVVSEVQGLDIHEVDLVPAGAIPKTGSGKIQRRLCRNARLDGTLAILYRYLPGASAQPASSHGETGGLARILKTRAFLPELDLTPERLAGISDFNELGLSSIQCIRIARRIEDAFGVAFSPVLFFKYRSFGELARYLSAERSPGDGERIAHGGAPGDPGDDDIAIIGMSCRFPGGGGSPEQFWENVVRGKDAISGIHESRPGILADARRYGAPGDGFPQWGGFIEGPDTFDAAFFAVSPLEAESMDPQQRKLLELTWDLIERSGYNPRSLAGKAVGVFVGAHASDYAELAGRDPALAEIYGAFLDSGLHMSLIPHRISRYFDFRGPSELVNTACSSSLVAVHRAVTSIRSGESRLAVACGINLMFTARGFLMGSKAGMLAADGRCKTFDRSADGFTRAEGYGAVLLKPYRLALRDNDTIYGRIRGTAVNHDGRSNSLRAPSLEGQKELILSAWKRAGVSPRTISYIETHGTGTSLGDPVEIQALQEAFREMEPAAAEPFCALGAVKTHIGHTESASGMAGLITVLMAMRRRTLPAPLHLRELNPLIRIGQGPFFIPREKRDWNRLRSPAGAEIPRRAGISSFGVGGANAHVVVEEFVPGENGIGTRPDPGRVPVVLSARSRERLLAYAASIQAHLEAFGKEIRLADLAYTLQAGREAMPERAVFAVKDIAELIRRLEAFVGGSPEEACAEATETGMLLAAEAWLRGEAVDWDALWPEPRPRRIGLPGYPFAADRYWIPEPQPENAAAPVQRVEESGPAPDGAFLLAPVWDPVPWPDEAAPAVATKTPVVIGGSSRQKESILAACPDARFLDLDETADQEAITARFRALSGFDHLVWIAPDLPRNAEPEIVADERLIGDQEAGLYRLFRIAKALLALDYGSGKLKWTVITTGTQGVLGTDSVAAAHTGIHGFIGALAEEYPAWNLSVIDVADEDGPLRKVLASPLPPEGVLLAVRGRELFRRKLVPVQGVSHESRPDVPIFRTEGVYVVIGGAGGLGRILTRYLKERYRAHVVWIGRSRREDLAETIEAEHYFEADARDEAALRRACAGIREIHPRIHGVVHSAVGIFDEPVAAMTEERFREICSVKIDLSVRLARVFGEASLDFLLFFSSLAALDPRGGMSGYAAGCAFKDAFAGSLARRDAAERPRRVKVMNWGYWNAGTGTRISDAFRRRIRHSGAEAIRPEEGMAALEKLLGGPFDQLAFTRTREAGAVPAMSRTESIAACPEAAPSVVASIAEDIGEGRTRTERPERAYDAEMEALMLKLLCATLQSLGVFENRFRPVPAFYGRWLDQSLSFLRGSGLIRGKGGKEVPVGPLPGLAELWEEWDRAGSAWLEDPDQKANALLAEACLRELPAILTGGKRATDVLFPQASLRLVEGIFRGNRVADTFNETLAEALSAAVRERLRIEPAARIRILEIGAGTGGTTEAVLRRLHPYRDQIDEYCYTDLSPAFLIHGREHFAEGSPCLRTRLFDVEKPPAAQSIPCGHYDFAIAANVLHAGRNIRRSLRNAKAVLKKHGLLLLNELSGRSLHAHLTFGLLEGWWLTEDAALRIPGAPGLYPDAWRQVLETEGFRRVLFPAESAHGLGQQIIVAESDGIVRQDRTSAASAQAPHAEIQRAPEQGSIAQGGLRAKSADYFRALVARTLRTRPHLIASSAPFSDYGIDSILIGQITRQLREVFDDLDPTFLYEVRTIDGLVDYLIEHRREGLIRLLGAADDGEQATAGRLGREPDATAEEPAPGRGGRIAIIGLSGRYPRAESVRAFWENLKTGRDCIGEIPADRWDWRAQYEEDPARARALGKSSSRWGGFLDDCWGFDPSFFNLTPRDAENVDPQERLFLEEAWKALEDSGYAPSRLSPRLRRRTGVFGGITKRGFHLYARDLPGSSPSTSFAALVNRVSFHLDLQGPSLPVDTMCSSALVAIHEACEYLRSGRGDLAIAGAVNLYLHPVSYAELTGGGMIASSKRCGAFAAGGTGFVPGEGAGAVVLKPYERAVADGDAIYAVIIGSGVRHDGKTAGYGLPDPNRQADLIRETLEEHGIDPRSISYIEAAANGSAQGDAIEMAALAKVFGDRQGASGSYRIGSVKPNIGHAEAASGMAQFTKVVLSLVHKTLAPTIVEGSWNPDIRFDRLPFEVQQEAAAWDRVLVDGSEVPLRAGITGIGAGGVNAHIVLEEYRSPDRGASKRVSPSRAPRLFVLSARNRDRLAAYARNWVRYLETAPEADLERIACTLQTGREEMSCRLAVVCESPEDLAEQLSRWLAGPEETGTCFSGDLGASRLLLPPESIAPVAEAGDLPGLAKLWILGNPVPWERLYRERPVRMAGLPTYPFAGKPCRLQAQPPGESRAEAFYAQEAKAVKEPFREDYLTFAPFPEKIPGFSMSRVLLNPERYPEECEIVKSRQIEMRQVLFCREDFDRIGRVLDIGCGYGTDVIRLASHHPHLEAHGYTITRAQAELAGRRIVEQGLSGRAAVFHRDSSRDPFPGRYDLVIGIEVTFHIREKEGLFRNIAASLNEGGRVLLADYLSNLRGPIVDPGLDLSIPTAEEWAELLAGHGLIIDEFVDVSPRIANFVFDPEVEENIGGLTEVSRAMWRNFAHQSTALEKGWIAYGLFRIRREEGLSRAERLERNRERLSARVPYTQALADLQARGRKSDPALSRPLEDAADPAGVVLSEKALPTAGPDSRAIRDRLIRIFEATLKLDPAEIEAARSFRELGIRSIHAVELIEAVNEAFDLRLPTSLLFECSTLDALADHVAKKLPERRIPKSPGGADHRCAPSDIAVIGLSCRSAGADGPEAFRELVSEGRDCIREIDNPEWLRFFRAHSDKPVPRRYGAMDGADAFDPLFFRISPREMQAMDVTQRILLEESYRALENAGIAPASLRERAVGTYVGSMGLRTGDGFSHFSLIGSETSILASRLAYFLDLKGPALAVNTACSSSLVAVDLACQALKGGEIDLAVAGGVSVWSHPGDFVTMNNAGMLSPTGECRPFDDGADGIVVGDGAGVVILKRLADALRDGDHVYGVIRGSGTNQDGQTAGITVPSFLSQSRLQAAVYRKAGIRPEEIQYIEAHGTATKLGDPVEIHALSESFGRFTDRKGFCAIGSLKANIGHTAAAAGVLGLIKVLLCLEQRQLPPSIHFSHGNRHIDFADSPVYVNTELRPWPLTARGTRLAAVSSFGFSGTNAHLVVEALPQRAAGARPEGPYLVPLSARTEERLVAVAQRLLAFIKKTDAVRIDPADLAYTLQVGRDAMEARACVVAGSLPELGEKLEAYLAGRASEDVYRSAADPPAKDLPGAPEVDRAIAAGDLAGLSEAWCAGASVDWTRLYRGKRPQRIPLPTYPFERERCAPEAAATAPAPESGRTETLLFRPVLKERPAAPEAAAVGYAERWVASFAPLDLPAGIHSLVLQTAGGGLPERYESASIRLFEHLKSLLQRPLRGPVLVQVVTAGEGEGRLFSGLIGLLRTAHAENPGIVGQLIEADPGEAGAGLIESLEMCGRSPEDTHIRLSGGERLVYSWEEMTEPPAVAEEFPWKDGGVYLITGGAGGLGSILMEAIAHSARSAAIVAAGRSPLSPEQESRMASLAAQGLRVTYRQADVSRAGHVAALVREMVRDFGRIDGILHCAGVIRDRFILKKEPEDFKTVLAPKAAGAVNLDEAARELDLDFFILFSSGAVLGNAGQADYAAANAFLDAFADYRNGLVREGLRHGRTLSVNWPLWQSGGMRPDRYTAEALRRRTGMASMETAAGLQALGRAWASDQGRVLVSCGEAAIIRRYLATGRPQGLRVLPDASGKGIPAGGLEDRIVHRLKVLVGETLQLSPDRIDAAEPLETYGIDSVIIAQLNEKLEAVFGEIPKTLFYEYQSLGPLAAHLETEYPEACAGWAGETDGRALPPLRRPQAAARPLTGDYRWQRLQEPIAVIGIAGSYAGAASPAAYWELLRSGKSAITEIPGSRWPLEGFYEGDAEAAVRSVKSYCRLGGFLEGFAEFDPLFFNISPADARNIDPQERLILTACWEAMEQSGHSRRSLQRRYDGSVGVFIGITKNSFHLHTRLGPTPETSRLPATSFSSVANRVSYHLNLNGPSMAVDTMCSSGLTALHEACEHIRRGDCRLAFAGAVNLYLHPRSYIDLCLGRLVTPEPEIDVFAKSGAGFIPGEGVGAVLLKPLDQAVSDGDPILGVIEGTGANHGGKTNGYTVPNPVRERELIQRVLRSAGCDPDAIDYIESAANGSGMGDAIEFEALSRVFRGRRGARCPLGSLKPAIGHPEAAAGLAQLTKVLLQLRHETLAPTRVRAGRLDEALHWEKSPLRLVTGAEPWVPGKDGRRRALIGSYGAGGSYAAAVVTEYRPGAERAKAAGLRRPELIVLSARTPSQLQRYAERMKVLLETAEVPLPSLAFTLQDGRDPMRFRLAFLASEQKEVVERLEEYLRNPEARRDVPEQVRTGDAKEFRVLSACLTPREIEDRAKAAMEKRDLEALARLWLAGFDGIDWSTLQEAPAPRCSLPTYPFDRRSFWYGGTDEPGPEEVPVPEEATGEEKSSKASDGNVRGAVLAALREILYLRESDELDPDATFLELGLDSVTVVRLIRKLSERLGLPLRETLVFDYPTAGELSAYIIGQSPGLRSSAPGESVQGTFRDRIRTILKTRPEVVPLQTEGNGPLLFCFHPMSGDAGLYEELAEAGRGRFRAIGIRSRGFLSPEAPLATIEEMGRHSAEIIRAVDPDGPYYLLGASMGGAVAFETARNLGRQARTLFLLESPLVENGADAALWHSDARQNRIMNANFLMIAMLHLDPEFRRKKELGGIRWPELEITAGEVAGVPDDALTGRLVDCIMQRGVRQAADVLRERLESMSRIHLANLNALSHYRVQARPEDPGLRAFLLRTRSAHAVSGEVYNPDYLRRVQAQRGSMAPFFAAWKRVLPQIETVEVEGKNHFDLLNSRSAAGKLCGIIEAGIAGQAAGNLRSGITSGSTEPIAVVGISGRFPGAADVDEFWRLLESGRSAITEFPADRGWDLERVRSSSEIKVRHGGFLQEIDRFDPVFFRIPPNEAALADPAERLFLQEAWRAIEDAGVDPAGLQGRPWGVFCGGSGNYTLLVNEITGISPHETTAGIPGRVSHTLGLTGPCFSTDAGCAASLLAIAQACDALVLGRCEAAVAGGVWIHSTPNLILSLSRAGLFSANGAGVLAKQAEGMLPGEAVGALVLKPLRRAVADGDRIYGLIEGWGSNHNGRTNGMTAPSGKSQAALLSDVYRRFGIDPGTIGLVEANATGTPLGDKMEVEALIQVFESARRDGTDRRAPFCALGSVENNIGHAFHASGIAHVIKILLALKHRAIPGTLCAEEPNPALNGGDGPFYVNSRTRAWEAVPGRKRRAAASSFGAAGTNVHLVIAEPPEWAVRTAEPRRGRAFEKRRCWIAPGGNATGNGDLTASAALSFITEEVLRITGYRSEDLDADAPLNRYGLDSLMGMRLLSAVNGRFSLELQLADLAEHPSLSALASLVEEERRTMPEEEAVDAPAGAGAPGLCVLPIVSRVGRDRNAPADISGPAKAVIGKLIRRGIALIQDGTRCCGIAPAEVDLPGILGGLSAGEREALAEGIPEGCVVAPVSSEQELSLYHSEVMNQTSRNIRHIYAVRAENGSGPLDLEVLNHALQRVAEDQEILRTYYLELEEGWAQVVAPESRLAFRRVEMTAVADFRRFIEERRARRLDLSGLPIWEGWVSRIGGTDYLGFVAHHSLADAFTAGLLFGRLMEAYRGIRSGETRKAPPAEPYWQYALRRAAPGGDRARSDSGYWRDALRNVSVSMRLPYARPPQTAAPGRLHAAGRRVALLPAPLGDAVGRFNREFGFTHTQLFTAAVAIALIHVIGNPDAVLQVMTSRRDRASLLQTLGEFTGVLFIPFGPIGREARIRQVLGGVKQRYLEGLRHAGITLPELLALAGLNSYEGYYGQTGDVVVDSIDLEAGIDGGPEAPGRSLFIEELLHSNEIEARTFATLSFQILKSEGRLSFITEYRRDLFDPEEMARLSDLIVRMVDEMVRDPEQTVSTLLLKTEAGSVPLKGRGGFGEYRDGRILAALKELEGGTLSLQELEDLIGGAGS